MGSVWRQIKHHDRAAFCIDLIAQQCRCSVNQTPLHAFLCDDEFSLLTKISERKDDRFDGMSFEFLAKVITPCDIESAIGRTQRFDLYTGVAQPGNPGTVRAETRPTTTTEGEHDCIGSDGYIPVGSVI